MVGSELAHKLLDDLKALEPSKVNLDEIELLTQFSFLLPGKLKQEATILAERIMDAQSVNGIAKQIKIASCELAIENSSSVSSSSKDGTKLPPKKRKTAMEAVMDKYLF